MMMMSVLGLFLLDILVKFSQFLASLRWPEGAHDLGVGGVSYLEILILYEERLVLEKVLPYGRRAGRPISVLAVPLGPVIDTWRSCRFIGQYLSVYGSAAWRPTKIYSL